ncbi:MAG: protein-export chaperone SecB, partial [Arenibacterium sp.]
RIVGRPDDQCHLFFWIECPRTLCPSWRRSESVVSRYGVYPPLNMENIDFVQSYRNELARRQAAQQAAEAPSS